MKKIFTQLPIYTQASNFQSNTKKIRSNTIETSTQLKKYIA
jgi:hypothetical protein